MAEFSNGTAAIDISYKQLLWEKLPGKAKPSKISRLALDKISDRNSNTGKPREISVMRLSSFEANQSFPRISRSQRHFGTRNFYSPKQPSSLPRLNMDRLCGDGQQSLSFTRATAPITREHKSGSPTCHGNASVLNSFGPPSSSSLPVFNPAKAVFTIDSKSTEILMVNDAACNLLGYPASELVGIHLCNILGCGKTETALSEIHLDGELTHFVSFCGKVVEMVAKSGDIIPVSLWITHLQSKETGGRSRCLAVAEPVERAVAQVLIDSHGHILAADKCTADLFQYEHKELFGVDLKTLIPCFKLPKDPGKHLTQEEKKQKATGRTYDSENFPLSLILDECLTDDGVVSYSVSIWVFASMSGLIVLGADGTIEGCNHHFVQMMFGYSRSEIMGKKITDLIPYFGGREYREIECEMSFGMVPSSSTICRDRGHKLGTTILPVNKNSQILGMKGRMSLSSVDDIIDSMGKLNMDYFSLSHGETKPETPKHQRRQRSLLERGINVLGGPKESFGTPGKGIGGGSRQQREDRIDFNSVVAVDQPEDFMLTSTPALKSKGWARKNMIGRKSDGVEESEEVPSASTILSLDPVGNDSSTMLPGPFDDGEYFGFGLHRDGALLNVKYRVQSAILTGSNRLVYCVWVAKNTNTDAEVSMGGGCPYGSEERNAFGNHTLANSDEMPTLEIISNCDFPSTKTKTTDSGNNNSIQKDVVSHFTNINMTSTLKKEGGEKDGTDDDDLADGFIMEEGEYQQKYSTLYQIGKGAFGCVCMGFQRSDHLLVITKFIRKDKVCEESWVVDSKIGRRVPLEIRLLTTLKHPNIVSILDVCENPTYFQLVMEKHGAGMDLFEFIDRNPDLDEPLISYIFRQVALAVKYLHSLQILHRDIKDENIILNEVFHAKLIDFGSATFSSPDRLFSNFYGTVEYCSPEVLAGNKYAGPELEMWSMGVTLYVLCFGENPFFDVEETLKAELNAPYTVSEGLQELLEWMLEKDPSRRCTVKQLVDHSWLNQHVDISQYIFNEVVQCKPHEEKPQTHYDMAEEIGSPNYSGIYFSDNVDDKEVEDNERGKQRSLEEGLNPSIFSSFSCIYPSSSSSHSALSSYHSVSHSCGSTSSTMTSTPSVISLGNVPASKEDDSRDEESEAEKQMNDRRFLRGGMSLQHMDADSEENITENKSTSNPDHTAEVQVKPMGKVNGKLQVFVRAEGKSLNGYDELDDSSCDEQDSFS